MPPKNDDYIIAVAVPSVASISLCQCFPAALQGNSLCVIVVVIIVVIIIVSSCIRGEAARYSCCCSN